MTSAGKADTGHADVNRRAQITLRKRVVVRVRPTRIRSWDRKLGLPPTGPAGGPSRRHHGHRPRGRRPR